MCFIFFFWCIESEKIERMKERMEKMPWSQSIVSSKVLCMSCGQSSLLNCVPCAMKKLFRNTHREPIYCS